MKKVIQSKSLHRMLCTLLLLCAGLIPSMADSGTWYYYKTTVTPSPSGGGKVYVSTSATNDPDYKQGSHSIEGREYSYGNNASLTFYCYAQANENYIFSHWAESSANGTQVSTSPSASFSRTFSGTEGWFGSINRTPINFYAVFVQQKGLIKARSADDTKGSVSIDKPNNTQGQEVTLKANPDASSGIMFLGWKKDNQDGPDDGYYSKANPLVLTANSETKGTYYAYFSDAADNVYIRLKNKKTGRFLSFYGDTKAVVHTRDYQNYKNIADGFKFTNSLKMISPADAQGNPSTVFLRSGHPQGTSQTIGADIVAHDVQYADLVTADVTTNKYMLTFERNGETFRIFTNYTLTTSDGSINLPTYLCDEGGDFAVMKTIQGLSAEDQSAAEWTLYALNESTTEGALGANTKAKFTKEGEDGETYYYTTMYTDFPYKMLDGVKAYYLVFKEELTHITDVVVFTQVNGNIVPANMAVILECPAVQNNITQTAAVTNRLVPLLPNTEGTSQIVNPDVNFLKGYVSVNGQKTANDKKNHYVLSVYDGVLGFYHSTAANMTPNKAYLEAPDVDEKVAEEYAKKLTFSFGEPDENTEDQEALGIELSEVMVDEDDSTPVYNLNGTKVAEGKAAEKLLRSGIYVKQGKKFVVE